MWETLFGANRVFYMYFNSEIFNLIFRGCSLEYFKFHLEIVILGLKQSLRMCNFTLWLLFSVYLCNMEGKSSFRRVRFFTFSFQLHDFGKFEN